MLQNQSLALLMLGSSLGLGMAQGPLPDVLRGPEKSFQITYFTISNNCYCSMKFALESVPGRADFGFLHGDGDGAIAPPRCPGGSRRNVK